MTKFDLLRTFASDQKRIEKALADAATLHQETDIDSAGAEVEEALREILRDRLPKFYDVTEGHIIDKMLESSPQLDVIVSDAFVGSSLLTAKDGTIHIPYEAVYAVGEVKSRYWHSKDPIGTFVAKTKEWTARLNRDLTPPGYLAHGITLGKGLTFGEKRPYRNPLFRFLFFGNKGDLDTRKLVKLVNDTDPKLLPCVVCIADHGLILCMKPGGANQVHLCPELVPATDRMWVFIPWGTDTLGAFVMLLVAHLRDCVLTTPDAMSYLNAGLKLPYAIQVLAPPDTGASDVSSGETNASPRP